MHKRVFSIGNKVTNQKMGIKEVFGVIFCL
jgi:hypothetical protein